MRRVLLRSQSDIGSGDAIHVNPLNSVLFKAGSHDADSCGGREDFIDHSDAEHILVIFESRIANAALRFLRRALASANSV